MSDERGGGGNGAVVAIVVVMAILLLVGVVVVGGGALLFLGARQTQVQFTNVAVATADSTPALPDATEADSLKPVTDSVTESQPISIKITGDQKLLVDGEETSLDMLKESLAARTKAGISTRVTLDSNVSGNGELWKQVEELLLALEVGFEIKVD